MEDSLQLFELYIGKPDVAIFLENHLEVWQVKVLGLLDHWVLHRSLHIPVKQQISKFL